MEKRFWKKSAIAAAALAVAAAKAPVNPVSGFIGTAVLNASAEKMGEFPADDFDQDTTDQEAQSIEDVPEYEKAGIALPGREAHYGVKIESEHSKVELHCRSTEREASHGIYSAGDGIIIDITPDEGYAVIDVYATDANGQQVALSESDGGKYVLEMPASDVTVYVKTMLKPVHGDNTAVQHNSDSAEYGIYANKGNGKVTFISNYNDRGAYHNMFPAGTGMQVKIEPDENYAAVNIYATDDNGNSVELRKNDTNVYTLTMPASNVNVHVDYMLKPNPGKNTQGVQIVRDARFGIYPDKGHGTVYITSRYNDHDTAHNKYAKDDGIRFTVRPDDGYLVADVYATDDNGNRVSLVNYEGSGYAFGMPESNVHIHVDYVPEVKKDAAYSIYADEGNGTVTFNAKSKEPGSYHNLYSAGTAMSIKVEPNSGYTVKNIYATDDNGKVVAVTGDGNNTYSLNMPESNVQVHVNYSKVSTKHKISIAGAAHGYVKAYRYSYNEEVTDRAGGKAVDIKVFPEEGYYLKSIKIVSQNSDTIRWYDDDVYSLGFEMPDEDVVIVPVFEKISSDITETAPADGIYRETAQYKNGKRQKGAKVYIPVAVEGIKDTYNAGEKPVYTLKTGDGTVLTEGRDYKVTETTRETAEGILHTLTFEGTGGPSVDKDSYLEYKGDFFKGTKVVTYIEKTAESYMLYSAPTGSMYIRSTSAASGKIYMPIVIEGIEATYMHGDAPHYTVRTADGKVLTEGRDYTVAERVTVYGNETEHLLCFKPVGKNTGGYQVISYKEIFKRG